ncbi:MAG TPA: type II secretion system protein [Candidatus Saccharimonadales bacterium]|nr:type II secretion system protein [Candidatus Saccharimonadales bacterium]
MKSKKGFTILELLIVITVIGILASIALVSYDPARRFADSRNSRRWSDVNTVLTAIHEYIVDNDGTLPTGLTAGQAVTDIGTCGTCDNLATPLANYIKDIPLDPSGGTTDNTGYTVAVDSNDIVTVAAPDAENGATISVSR